MKELLKKYKSTDVDRYVAYTQKLKADKANWWAKNITDAKYAEYFERVASDGLVFDGKHITLQNTGISYDYQAMKNKMLLAYPETLIECEIVYKGDTFTYSREGNKVQYTYVCADPFNKSEQNIVGAFCVIRNKRGEFLERLSLQEINKRRAVAKTDMIWKKWLHEMILKTIMRKAIGVHFEDVFTTILDEDNQHYNVDAPVDIDIQWKQEVEAITTMDELSTYYKKHKSRGPSFAQFVLLRKKELS